MIASSTSRKATEDENATVASLYLVETTDNDRRAGLSNW